MAGSDIVGICLNVIVQALTMVEMIFGTIAIRYGLGNHTTIVLEAGQMSNMLLFTWLSIFMFHITVAFGKLTVVSLLLEIQGQTREFLKPHLFFHYLLFGKRCKNLLPREAYVASLEQFTSTNEDLPNNTYRSASSSSTVFHCRQQHRPQPSQSVPRVFSLPSAEGAVGPNAAGKMRRPSTNQLHVFFDLLGRFV